MIKLERTSVMNFDNAIRGARNPMNSWDRMDSHYEDGNFELGENDAKLISNLCHAGSASHRKFLRQIFVSVDITAPLYWWKEFDTYKVATVANSTSTMHKIQSKPLTVDPDMFSIDHISSTGLEAFGKYLEYLEYLRTEFNDTKDKAIWYELIQMLPTNFNQMRTVTMNYENLVGMYYDRKNHKLQEWREFCKWVETLPYAEQMILIHEDVNK